MDVHVAVIHHYAFSEVVFQHASVDDVEVTVTLQPLNHLVYSLLVVVPLLLVLLNFLLRSGEALVELL